MYDKVAEINILYDLYGQLLTKKQSDVVRMYYEEDLSLAEIADEIGISRQGVHDTVKKSEKILKEYEEKLKLLYRMIETNKTFKSLETKIDEIITSNTSNSDLVNELEEIKTIIIENI